MKRLLFTVTNELNYDQRMIRICTSLQNAGFDVLLVGRNGKSPLQQKIFAQKRLFCFFKKGKLFYIEYNVRLFFFLLFARFDLVCAIDLDTILPCYLASVLKRKKRVYDAHELFTEMKEVVSRSGIYKLWKRVEKICVPRFAYGYTVNTYIRELLKRDYGVNYEVIRNIPFLEKHENNSEPGNFILYQGAVNHGRSFETLIPAFEWIDTPLYIYGDGNFMEEAKALIRKHKLQDKVFLKGMVEPSKLKEITSQALLGITIFENKGLSNYFSLANRFFDYMHACIPQLCVAYPAYSEINKEYKIAVLVNDLSASSLAESINAIIQDKALQTELRKNSCAARKVFNWQEEEKKLVLFYQKLFAG